MNSLRAHWSLAVRSFKRIDCRTYAAAALLVTAVGCGNFQEAVRARAANDFNCPATAITLMKTRPYAQPQAYTARGCGQGEDYEGGCDVRGCLVEKRPSLAAQARMRRGSPAPESRAPSGSREGAGPDVVSLTLHNECPRTVRLFFGATPKFGSGTDSSISANSSESHMLREGDMIWIVDGSGNGMSSLTASRGQTNVTITRSCTGFASN